MMAQRLSEGRQGPEMLCTVVVTAQQDFGMAGYLEFEEGN